MTGKNKAWVRRAVEALEVECGNRRKPTAEGGLSRIAECRHLSPCPIPLQPRSTDEPRRTTPLADAIEARSPTRVHALDERARWLANHVLPHEPALRAWLLRRGVPGIDVDDVVQETYARLTMVESVAGIRNVRAYLIQTAHSIIVSQVRRSRIVSIQAMADLEALNVQSEEPDPEEQVIARDELNRLALAIAAMPSRAREVFVLRKVRGFSQREVAGQLGLSENTVEKHMSRGFQYLADSLGRGGKKARQASKENAGTEDGADAASEQP